MKYLYKETGVIVESSIPLDSSLFTPMKEKAERDAAAPAENPAEETETAELDQNQDPLQEAEKPIEKPAAEVTAKKTTASKTTTVQKKTAAKRTAPTKK